MTDGLLPPERSMWRLRVVVDDARGRLAALAMTLSRAGANIHTVEVHPLPDGGALDELLLSTPADGRSSEVLRAAHAAGGRDAALWPCDVHDFVDEPTRVLRLSARVAHDPTQLPAVLAELLHAREGDGDDDRAVLVVATDAGDIRLERSDEPFTPAERARALALAGVARSVSPAPGLGEGRAAVSDIENSSFSKAFTASRRADQ